MSCPQAGLVSVWAQSSVCLYTMLQHCWLCSGEQRCLLGTTHHRSPHRAQAPCLVCDLHPCLMVLTLLVPAAQRGAGGISLWVPGVRGDGVTLPAIMCLLGSSRGSRTEQPVPVWAQHTGPHFPVEMCPETRPAGDKLGMRQAGDGSPRFAQEVLGPGPTQGGPMGALWLGLGGCSNPGERDRR